MSFLAHKIADFLILFYKISRIYVFSVIFLSIFNSYETDNNLF
jgi:hypothetical protein